MAQYFRIKAAAQEAKRKALEAAEADGQDGENGDGVPENGGGE
jgi:hypothetical protein